MDRITRDKLLTAARTLVNELPKSTLHGPKTEQMLQLAKELKATLHKHIPPKMAAQSEV